MSPVAQSQTQDLAKNKDSDIIIHSANTTEGQEVKQRVRYTALPSSTDSPVARVATTETQQIPNYLVWQLS